MANFKCYTPEEIHDILMGDDRMILKALAESFINTLKNKEFIDADKPKQYAILISNIGNKVQELIPDANFENLNVITIGFVNDFSQVAAKEIEQIRGKKAENN